MYINKHAQCFSFVLPNILISMIIHTQPRSMEILLILRVKYLNIFNFRFKEFELLLMSLHMNLMGLLSKNTTIIVIYIRYLDRFVSKV